MPEYHSLIIEVSLILNLVSFIEEWASKNEKAHEQAAVAGEVAAAARTHTVSVVDLRK